MYVVYLLQNIYLFLFLTAEKTPTEKTPVVRKPEPTKKVPVVRKPTEKSPVVCKHNSHWFPVASNGKLLDVAVITEST